MASSNLKKLVYDFFFSETNFGMVRRRYIALSYVSMSLPAVFSAVIVGEYLKPFGFDTNSWYMEAIFWAFWLVNFVVYLYAKELSPYGKNVQVHKIYKVGCLHKSWVEVVALCVSVVLRYALKIDYLCYGWISLVAEIQIIYKLRYGPCDFWFSDVFFGLIMQGVMVYQDVFDGYALIAKSLLCGLIIYHRHWCTPSSTTIFSETDDVHLIQEPDLENGTNV